MSEWYSKLIWYQRSNELDCELLRWKQIFLNMTLAATDFSVRFILLFHRPETNSKSNRWWTKRYFMIYLLDVPYYLCVLSTIAFMIDLYFPLCSKSILYFFQNTLIPLIVAHQFSCTFFDLSIDTLWTHRPFYRISTFQCCISFSIYQINQRLSHNCSSQSQFSGWYQTLICTSTLSIHLFRYLFGLKADVRNNIHFGDEDTVIYPAGHTVVIYNYQTRTQQFLFGRYVWLSRYCVCISIYYSTYISLFTLLSL